jgi:hypothetical protein
MQKISIYVVNMVVALMLIGALVLVMSRPASGSSDDGRLNQVAHLGGAVVYCVDRDGKPTHDYPGQGIQVWQDGQGLLMNVLTADIDRVLEKPERNTLIKAGKGPYGALELYRLTSGEFQLNGYDEHGKLFEFRWNACLPVNPPASGSNLNPILVSDTPGPSPTPGGPTSTPFPSPTPKPTSTASPTPTPIAP